MNHMVLFRKKEAVVCAGLSDGKLESVQLSPAADQDAVGTIYVGKVQNIVKNIHGAFVELAEKKIGYLPMDEIENSIFLNEKKKPVLKNGDELLVQLIKEPLKTKQAGLSTNLSLNGTFLVLSSGKTTIGVSSKIKEKEERERLSKILFGFRKETNDLFGIIARTSAKGAEEAVLRKEYEQLSSCFHDILRKARHASCFSRVYVPRPSYLDFAFDSNSSFINQITTDDKDLYSEISKLYEDREQKPKIVFYQDTLISMERYYSLISSISKCLKKQVWLKSGAYLVIEPTEALTVIDVNTGKAIAGKRAPEETFHKINLEAAKEIARQIRLRNLSGIILVDFIDMKNPENQVDLLATFRRFLSKDPVKTILVDQTKLQLVEITRMKIKRPLYEELAQLNLLEEYRE
ncbi:MAG: ribonuclease E/G [Clostridiales bacterium]|nr:ribonuclease E/G [Clostridiales bacterium]